MRIGSMEVGGLARLASTAGISNAPFRLIAGECGSGLTTTGEMDADSLLPAHQQAEHLTAYHPEERPVAMQLLGADADVLCRAAEKCLGLGADIVDLNEVAPDRHGVAAAGQVDLNQLAIGPARARSGDPSGGGRGDRRGGQAW